MTPAAAGPQPPNHVRMIWSPNSTAKTVPPARKGPNGTASLPAANPEHHQAHADHRAQQEAHEDARQHVAQAEPAQESLGYRHVSSQGLRSQQLPEFQPRHGSQAPGAGQCGGAPQGGARARTVRRALSTDPRHRNTTGRGARGFDSLEGSRGRIHRTGADSCPLPRKPGSSSR